MGCGGSKYKEEGKATPGSAAFEAPTSAEESVGLLIKGATGLRNADVLGQSDCFCLCRVGPAGSAFEAKDPRTERHSHTLKDTLAPQWNFGVSYPRALFEKGHELHIMVKDLDLFTKSDILGEVRISWSSLQAKQDVLVEYALQHDSVKDAGRVTVLVGYKTVWGMVSQDMYKRLNEESAWKDLRPFGSHFWQFLGAWTQFQVDTKDDVLYQLTMLDFLIKGQSGPTGLRDWFLERSRDSRGEDTYEWQGPLQAECTTYSGHAGVVARLSAMPARLGSNNLDGSIYRNNALGFQIFPHAAMWPELGDKATIGLGASQEDHAFMRPWLDRILGSSGTWKAVEIRQAAEAFWVNRATCKTGSDFGVWVTRVLHKVKLGIDLSEEQGASFMDMQFKILIGTTIPVFAHGPLIGDALVEKQKRLEQYKAAFAKQYPNEAAKFTAEQKTIFASGMMDSLIFAGGASVPSVIGWSIGLLFSKWGRENLPSGFALRQSNMKQYVMETIRRFPPVAGVGFVERSLQAGKPDQQIFSNLSMAQRDPRVWGPEPDAFKLRPLEDYARLSVGFAEPAYSTSHASNAHGCPAKDLSIVMVCEFLRAFLKTTIGLEAMERDEPLDMERWKSSLAPEEVKISEYGVSPFDMTRRGKE